jgi:hypothetical protein
MKTLVVQSWRTLKQEVKHSCTATRVGADLFLQYLNNIQHDIAWLIRNRYRFVCRVFIVQISRAIKLDLSCRDVWFKCRLVGHVFVRKLVFVTSFSPSRSCLFPWYPSESAVHSQSYAASTQSALQDAGVYQSVTHMETLSHKNKLSEQILLNQTAGAYQSSQRGSLSFHRMTKLEI